MAHAAQTKVYRSTHLLSLIAADDMAEKVMRQNQVTSTLQTLRIVPGCFTVLGSIAPLRDTVVRRCVILCGWLRDYPIKSQSAASFAPSRCFSNS